MSQVKRALVTGGAGFVGTNLVKRLLNEGYEVVSIDNYYTGKKENHVLHSNVTYLEYDITTIIDYAAFGKFDIVYHLAAIARIQPSFEMPLEYFKANATATFNIAMYCAKNNIPMQFAGSSSHHSGKFKEVADMFKYNMIEYADDKPGEAVNTLCEDILAKEILDWEPKINLIDYINKWNTTRNG